MKYFLVLLSLISLGVNGQDIRIPVTSTTSNLKTGMKPGIWTPTMYNCVEATEQVKEVRILDVKGVFIRTFDDFSKEVYQSNEAEASYFDFAEVESKSVKELFEKRTQKSITFMLKASLTLGIRSLKDININEQGKTQLNIGVDNFVKAFGTHFVYSEVIGGVSFILIQYESDEKSLIEKINNSSEGSVAYEGFNAGMQNSFKSEITKNSSNSSLTVIRSEVGERIIDLSNVDIKNIDAALDFLKSIDKDEPTNSINNTKPIYQSLKPYAEILVGDAKTSKELNATKQYWNPQLSAYYAELVRKINSIDVALNEYKIRYDKWSGTKQSGGLEFALNSLKGSIDNLEIKQSTLKTYYKNIYDTKTIRDTTKLNISLIAPVAMEIISNTIVNPRIDYKLIGVKYSDNLLTKIDETGLSNFADAAEGALIKVSMRRNEYLPPYYSDWAKKQNFTSRARTYFLEENGNLVYDPPTQTKDIKSMFSIMYRLDFTIFAQNLFDEGFFRNKARIVYLDMNGNVKSLDQFGEIDLEELVDYGPFLWLESQTTKKSRSIYMVNSSEEIMDPEFTPLVDGFYLTEYDWLATHIITEPIQPQLNISNYLNSRTIKFYGKKRNPYSGSPYPNCFVEISDVIGGKHYVPFIPIDWISMLKNHQPTMPSTFE